MINLPITGFYLSLLALLYMVLAIRVIKLRFHFKTGIGDGGHAPLLKAIRVHGNFDEYTPITVLLLACAELNGSAPLLLHAIGAAYFVGRILHRFGLTKSSGTSPFRFIGTMSAFIALVVLSVENIRLFIFAA